MGSAEQCTRRISPTRTAAVVIRRLPVHLEDAKQSEAVYVANSFLSLSQMFTGFIIRFRT